MEKLTWPDKMLVALGPQDLSSSKLKKRYITSCAFKNLKCVLTFCRNGEKQLEQPLPQMNYEEDAHLQRRRSVAEEHSSREAQTGTASSRCRRTSLTHVHGALRYASFSTHQLTLTQRSGVEEPRS